MPFVGLFTRFGVDFSNKKSSILLMLVAHDIPRSEQAALGQAPNTASVFNYRQP